MLCVDHAQGFRFVREWDFMPLARPAADRSARHLGRWRRDGFRIFFGKSPRAAHEHCTVLFRGRESFFFMLPQLAFAHTTTYFVKGQNSRRLGTQAHPFIAMNRRLSWHSAAMSRNKCAVPFATRAETAKPKPSMQSFRPRSGGPAACPIP